MPEPDVIVREVGFRDGLKNVATFFPTDSKIAWMTAENEARVREMQVCSFVPEKVFAQFRDCTEVVSHALRQPDLVVSAYVPNVKGAQRAFERLVEIREIVERELPDEPLHSAIAAAGLPKGFTRAGLVD